MHRRIPGPGDHALRPHLLQGMPVARGGRPEHVPRLPDGAPRRVMYADPGEHHARRRHIQATPGDTRREARARGGGGGGNPEHGRRPRRAGGTAPDIRHVRDVPPPEDAAQRLRAEVQAAGQTGAGG